MKPIGTIIASLALLIVWWGSPIYAFGPRTVPDALSYLPGLPPAQAGIQTKVEDKPDVLINSVFRDETCFTIGMGSVSGRQGQIGTFSNAQAAVGFDEGIIMSTGLIGSASGPNKSNFSGFSHGTTSNDPDIRRLTTNQDVYDVVVFEFDFTPTVEEISFEYVFASEEYCELVFNAWNDVFGFLISGPGIDGPFSNGAINIARIPGSEDSVSIKTVNHLNNTQYFNSNTPASFPLNCGMSPAVAAGLIEYDGFTKPLKAKARVIPCETYHIRMILADIGDDIYDSAVLLKAKSFAAGLVTVAEPVATAEALTNDAPYEGCSDGLLAFTRATNDTREDLIVEFTVSPTGTATPGLDYTPLTDTFVIPAGKMTDTLVIDILPDNLPEGQESVILRIANTCFCDEGTVELFIADPPPLSAMLGEMEGCADTPLALQPTTQGGVGSLAYQWSGGASDSILMVTQAGNYSVTVTDNCQQQATATARVELLDIRAHISGQVNLCSGNETGRVPVVLSGGDRYELTVRRAGMVETFSDVRGDTFWINVSRPGNVELVAVNSGGCSGKVSGLARVSREEIGFLPQLKHPSCAGSSNGRIEVVTTSPTPLRFRWRDRSDTTSTLENLPAGRYTLRATDASGCWLEQTFVLTEPPPLVLTADGLREETCRSAGAATLRASGGSPGYRYRWPDGREAAMRNDLSGGRYTVTVTDGTGCSDTLSVAINSRKEVPNLQLEPVDTVLDCQQTEVNLRVAAASPSTRYEWKNESGAVIGRTRTLLVQQAGVYRIILTDTINGCSSSRSTRILQDTSVLRLIVPDSLSLTCETSEVTLSATAANYRGAIDYEWFDAAGNSAGRSASISGINRPGTYSVTAVRVDNGCRAAASLRVVTDTLRPQLSLQPSGTLNCRDSVVRLSPAAPLNERWTYAWSATDGGTVRPADVPIITVNRAGGYELLVLDTLNGCAQTFRTTVRADYREPGAEAGPDQVLPCTQNAIDLIGKGQQSDLGYRYFWLNERGQLLGQSARFSAAAGTYTLRVQHPESFCESTDQVTVRQEGPTDLQYELVEAPCPEAGGQILIGAVTGGKAPYTYRLDTDSGFSPETERRGVLPGIYQLSVKDALGCTWTETVELSHGEPLRIHLDNQELRPGDSIRLIPLVSRPDVELVSYRWLPAEIFSCSDCPQALARPTHTRAIRLEVVDANGCRATADAWLFVDQRQTVFAPNAFSPYTVDSKNDYFTLYGNDQWVDRILDLRVFNRWGVEVFSGQDLPLNDEQRGWDGRYAGQNLPGGIYIYSATILLRDGETVQLQGEVQLMH